jgi:hypothetical protein
MITNELLEAKYQAQRILAEQGGQDLRSYVQHVHQIVQHTERKYGLKFRYGRIRRKGASSPGAAPRGPSLAQARQVGRETAG